MVYCLGFHETNDNIQLHLDVTTSHVPIIYFCNFVIGQGLIGFRVLGLYEILYFKNSYWNWMSLFPAFSHLLLCTQIFLCYGIGDRVQGLGFHEMSMFNLFDGQQHTLFSPFALIFSSAKYPQIITISIYNSIYTKGV